LGDADEAFEAFTRTMQIANRLREVENHREIGLHLIREVLSRMEQAGPIMEVPLMLARQALGLTNRR